MIAEVRLGLRALFRSPGHSAIIVLVLGLGIGATTTIAGLVNGVLIRPLPFPDQERLHLLWQRAPGVGVAEDWFSTTQYFDLREQATVFEESALIFGRNVTLTGDNVEPQRVGALEVSSSFFDLLGVDPLLGRLLTEADDKPGSAVKAILGEGLFERRFGSDRTIIGRTISIDGKRVEVVGILGPLALDADILPTLITVPIYDLVMSLPVEDPQATTSGSENYNILARTRQNVSLQQVEANLLAVAEEFVKDPGSLGAGLTAGSEYRIGAVPILDQVVKGVRLPLLVLLGATGLLLAVACANVANLLLTRASRRRRDISIRSALGAPRGKLVGQAMCESLLLAVTGGLLGLGLACLAILAVRQAAPEDLPRLGEIAIDPTVLLFAGSLCLVSCLLFGLGPALNTSRAFPADVLRETAPAVRAGSLWRGGSRFLVILQIALSLMLTVGAGLAVRSLLELRSIDPGFRPEGVLSFRLSLVGDRYREKDARVRFNERLNDRLRDLSGTVTAGGISMLPLTRGYAWTDFVVEGQETSDENRDRMVADLHLATAGYFEAMGIPLLAGRTFVRSDDGSPPTVVINRAFAERFWPIDDSVGKWVGRTPQNKLTIIGVVDDVRQYGLDADPRPTVFYPHAMFGSRTLYWTVKGSGGASALSAPIVDIVRSLDPLLPVFDVETMSDRVGDSLARQRILMTLLSLFGFIALTVAIVGLYGVLSFTVATHTREIGIRKALGAESRDLYRLVLSASTTVTGLGLVIGLGISLAGSRLVADLVHGVSTTDPMTFVLAAMVVLAVAAAASLVPARRAAAVDPLIALRQE